VLRRAFAAAVALLSCLACWSTASAVAAGGQRSITDDPQFNVAAEQARARKAARAARRATPAERRARDESRAAHRGLDRAAARALARRSFGALAADVWAPLRLREGEHFAGYLNDYAAQIDRDGAQPLVAKTFVPMRDEDTTGTARRVSLALREQATAIVAENPLVDLSIARASNGSLRLQDSGLTVTPVVDSVDGVVEDGRVFAESVGTDLDQIIQPTTLGAQYLWQARSAASPEHMRLQIGLPDGARLRLASEDLAISSGPITAQDATVRQAVEVVQGEEVIARIDVPLTVDSDGEPVRTYYELDGQDVLVRFPHRDQDLKYPLLVDPTVTETWSGGDWGSDGWGNGQFLNGGPHAFSFARNCCGRTGLQIGAYQFGTYYDGAVGQWAWNTYPGSYISRAEFSGLDQIDAGNTLFTGVFNTQTSQWEGLFHDYLTFNGYARSFNASSDNNAAVFGIQMHGTYARNAGPGLVSMSNVTLYLGDRNPPTVSASSHTYNGAWTNQATAEVRLIAGDYGLGLKAVGVARTDKGDPNSGSLPDESHYWLSLVNNASCRGNRRAACWNSFDTATSRDANGNTFPNGKLTYRLDALPEGIHQIRASAHQYEGNQYGTAAFSPTWTVRRDITAPSVSLEGPVMDRAQGGYPFALDDKDELWIYASDALSGAAKVEVRVDNALKFTASEPCGDGCDMESAWTFDPTQFSVGQHTIAVTAYDVAGNTKTQSFSLDIDPSAAETYSERQALPVLKLTNETVPPTTQPCLVNYASPSLDNAALILTGAWTGGIETTLFYSQDDYWVLRCDSQGTIVSGQRVMSVETPTGQMRLHTAQISTTGDGSLETLSWLYPSPTDPIWVSEWSTERSTAIAATLPPTKVLGQEPTVTERSNAGASSSSANPRCDAGIGFYTRDPYATWPDDRMEYEINPANHPGATAQISGRVTKRMVDGARTWTQTLDACGQRKTDRFKAVLTSTTSTRGFSSSDRHNVVAFLPAAQAEQFCGRTDDKTALACANVKTSPGIFGLTSVDIRDADIVFSRKFQWSSGLTSCSFVSGAAVYDVWDVATHEFGHGLGLMHHKLKKSVMYPEGQPCSKATREHRVLSLGDVQGVRHLYGR